MGVKTLGAVAVASVAMGLLAAAPAHAAVGFPTGASAVTAQMTTAATTAATSDGFAALSGTALAGTAPACVARYVNKVQQAVILRNTCKKKMHVKVIIKHGPDSPCFGMGKGGVRAWKWGTPSSSYERTVVC
ncbi:hypothetical protein [Nonomuraea zeae]|uniref:Uncharacterized protein n=1 Tax=Nonomuraea zeae TaxID=1642303 RepID=A0A5S4FMW0_9ACTN|nr:hypothetical protein [Nonomuraea zeae]TMR21531.1 hypothetical protein ETD85_50725 [Nonomuraea zeae]